MSSFELFHELTRRQLRERTQSLVVIPLAATEQHGEHLPVTTDTVIVSAIANRACELAGEAIDVTLVPTISVGVSGHHVQFGGTLSVTSQTFISVLVDLVVALRDQGFTRFLFVNGHGGNDSSMRVAVETLALTGSDDGSVGGLSYWSVIESALQPMPEFPIPGHAGAFETSVMLALRPELVHIDQATADQGPFALATNEVVGITDARLADWRSSDGRTDGPSAATREFGEFALEAISREVSSLAIKQVALLDERRT